MHPFAFPHRLLAFCSFCRMWDGICRTDTLCRHAARSWASTSSWESRGSSAPTACGHRGCPAASPPRCWPTTRRTAPHRSASRSSMAPTPLSHPASWPFRRTAQCSWTACIRGLGALRNGAGPAGTCSILQVSRPPTVVLKESDF